MESPSERSDGIDSSRHPAAAGRASGRRTGSRGRSGSRAGRLLPAARVERIADRHGALADPVRLQLLNLIVTHPDGEVRAGALPERVGRTKATVSHHLGLLLEAGLLRRRRQGRLMLYRATPKGREAVSPGR